VSAVAISLLMMKTLTSKNEGKKKRLVDWNILAACTVEKWDPLTATYV